MTSEGYLAEMARHAVEGQRRLQLNPPDLIILDVMLPDVDGLTFCQTLRADPATQMIPIVLMTAAQLQRDQIACDVNGVVRKPFRIDTLIALLGRILR